MQNSVNRPLISGAHDFDTVCPRSSDTFDIVTYSFRHTMIDMWGSDLDNLVYNLTSTSNAHFFGPYCSHTKSALGRIRNLLSLVLFLFIPNSQAKHPF